MATTILLAEDDPNLGLLLSEYLVLKGYDAVLARNGDEALDLFLKGNFEVCILDVMMPKKDGFMLAKEIRMKNKTVPIIFLTAKGQMEDTLQGFKVGADDYMTKPFSMEELTMRIEAILRRVGGNVKETVKVFEIGKIHFDAQQQFIRVDDVETKLTAKENELLRVLAQNKNQIVGRSFALKQIWGDDSYFNARSMDVYITKLRKHLKADPSINLMNMHGEGFKLIV